MEKQPPIGDTLLIESILQDLIEKLQLLDMPRREAEVYLALLQKKDFAAPEISKITSVSRTKIYEILQNLVKKGLANESYKNGIKFFSGISPDIVMKNISNEFDRKKIVADQLQEELMELKDANVGSSEPLDYIEILTEKEQIKERWLSIQNNTKEELLLFSKSPYSFSLEDNLDYEKALLDRGVEFKCIYETCDIKSEENKYLFTAILEKYSEIGEKIRIVDSLTMKLCISDNIITMLALNDRVSLKPSITSMFVNHPSFADSLKRVFESFWISGQSLDEFKNNISADTSLS
jgi:sugar-specific transcriptional regulator TrmB